MRTMNQDHTQINATKEQKILVFIGIIFILAGIIAASVGIMKLLQGYQAQNWPTTTGIIISSKTKLQHSSSIGNPTLIAEVIYEYTVDGRLFRSDSVSPGQFGSSSIEHAKSEAQAYPEQSTVTVFYNPADPNQAFLKPGWGWILFIPLLVGAIVALVGYFLLLQGMRYTLSKQEVLGRSTRFSTQPNLPKKKEGHLRLPIVLLLGFALALSCMTIVYRVADTQQQPLPNSESLHSSKQTSPRATASLSTAEFEITQILKLYVIAQKDYKSLNGRYTKYLDELTLPKIYQSQPSQNGNVEISGYTFSHVEFNGATSMDYRQDFVICAIPQTDRSAGLKSFAVGPKGIVIYHHGNAEMITNATQLSRWEIIP